VNNDRLRPPRRVVDRRERARIFCGSRYLTGRRTAHPAEVRAGNTASDLRLTVRVVRRERRHQCVVVGLLAGHPEHRERQDVLAAACHRHRRRVRVHRRAGRGRSDLRCGRRCGTGNLVDNPRAPSRAREREVRRIALGAVRCPPGDVEAQDDRLIEQLVPTGERVDGRRRASRPLAHHRQQHVPGRARGQVDGVCCRRGRNRCFNWATDDGGGGHPLPPTRSTQKRRAASNRSCT
jgi:hypothetical protein